MPSPTKLHEILAVEASAEGHFKEMTSETTKLFGNKPNHFTGQVKRLQMFGEPTPDSVAKEQAESETVVVSTTVPAELKYLADTAANFFDIVYQKDEANQRAKADIIINGVVIAADVPSSTLLGLENKLKQVRLVLDQIPTLPAGKSWEIDSSAGEYQYKDTHPEFRSKTAKTFKSHVLYEATDKHPAQIEKWEEMTDIGQYTITKWSGMITVNQKSVLLKRFDELTKAVKQARQRANNIEVVTDLSIGKQLFDYLLAGTV